MLLHCEGLRLRPLPQPQPRHLLPRGYPVRVGQEGGEEGFLEEEEVMHGATLPGATRQDSCGTPPEKRGKPRRRGPVPPGALAPAPSFVRVFGIRSNLHFVGFFSLFLFVRLFIESICLKLKACWGMAPKRLGNVLH